MPDLDLDAIRAWWSNFSGSVDAGLRQLPPELGEIALRDVGALLAEVERLRAENERWVPRGNIGGGSTTSTAR